MILGLLACAASGEADDVCAAERIPDGLDPTGWSVGVRVPYEAGAVRVLARWPSEGTDLPVVVVVHGGWTASGTDFERSTPYLRTAAGFVVLHVDLPGSAWTDGENDRRGALSRAAVGATLRWMAGSSRDLGGCTLGERVPAADPSRYVLLGGSNGGNLAIATLADPALERPEPVGLVVWETPAGPQFAGVELGADPTVYTPGSCALQADRGIVCTIPEDSLLAAGDALCFDVDTDGECEAADVRIPGVEDPISGLIMASPTLVAAATARGVLPASWADQATADAWWAWRDGARLAPSLAAREADLPVILVASEVDHVQTLSDHPHVFGLGEALQAAGQAWVRLNPGRAWLSEEAAENAPNAPLRLDSPSGRLLTESEEAPLEDTMAAAVNELLDRDATGEW